MPTSHHSSPSYSSAYCCVNQIFYIERQLRFVVPCHCSDYHRQPTVRTMEQQVAIQQQIEEAKLHFHTICTDKTYFVARLLTQLKNWLHVQANIDAEETMLAHIITNLLGLYLTFGESAEFVANSILTFVPIGVTFNLPDEKPSDGLLVIYWSFYAVLTLFDSGLQAIPGWYSLKMMLLALLFLRPFCLAAKLQLWLTMRSISLRAARGEDAQAPQVNAAELDPEVIEQLRQLVRQIQQQQGQMDNAREGH